jgi:hypothetical protein
MIYTCDKCYFITSNKKDYNRHLLTRKHSNMNDKTCDSDCSNVIFTPTPTVKPHLYPCQYCNRSFKSRTTIYQHKAKCKLRVEQKQQEHDNILNEYIEPKSELNTTENYIVGAHPYAIHEQDEQRENINDTTPCVDDKITITKEMFLALVKDNQEMMKMLKSLTEQQQTTQFNNTTINANSNNTNCNNPTFNMNMFLNEKCKDAMNMKDFVNSIQLNMTDMENVGRLGYVEGMSSIFIDNLQKTDIYKRPVHCSDVKRETLYVKENNQWEREGPDHAKMTNAVLAVEHKNVVLVNEWAKANPRCMNSNTRENDKYIRLSKIVTDGEKDGNIDKVIRKVAKRVAIEKDDNS